MDKQDGYIPQRLELLAVRVEEVQKKWAHHKTSIETALAPDSQNEAESGIADSNPNSSVANSIDLLIRKLESTLSDMNEVGERIQL